MPRFTSAGRATRPVASSRAASAALTLLCALAFALPAQAEEGRDPASPSAGDITFDLILMRPLGVLETTVGLAIFAIAAPLAAPGGGVHDVWDRFVGVPYDDTFARPLGEP